LPLPLWQADAGYHDQNRTCIVMEASTFTDYYEILEINANASSETIDRMFRFLAQRYHPDNRDTGDHHRFHEIVRAHDIRFGVHFGPKCDIATSDSYQ